MVCIKHHFNTVPLPDDTVGVWCAMSAIIPQIPTTTLDTPCHHFLLPDQLLKYKAFPARQCSTSQQKPFPALALTLSDPTSDLVQHYDFPLPLRCQVTSDTFFVAFVHPLRCRSLFDTFPHVVRTLTNR